jgi:O-antigen biosynthesis protein WbqP
MIRVFDIFLSITGLIIGSPVLIIIFVIGWVYSGSPIFRQVRVGRNQKPFILIKFRTMKENTLPVSSHLVDSSSVTFFGRFLRQSKLDELPQLWNVLKGEMSLVGPRPCLITQKELIKARNNLGVFLVRPGITGLAQINGIDMSTPRKLAKVDHLMISAMSWCYYIALIGRTARGRGRGDAVRY